MELMYGIYIQRELQSEWLYDRQQQESEPA